MDNGHLGYNCPMGECSVFSGIFLMYCKWWIMDITMHRKKLKSGNCLEEDSVKFGYKPHEAQFLKSTS